MRILITNDDGLHAPGLSALARAASDAGHEVLAVAPEGDRSGSGAAIGNIGESAHLRYRRMPLEGLGHVESYELDAPPALCVIATGLEAFGPRPDLVLSGVNPGLNTGRVTLHSGTVGAALTAAHFGLSAVAVSIDGVEHSVKHWETAAELAVQAGEWAAAAEGLVTLNLSVPDLPRPELRVPRHGELARFGAIRTEVISRTEERIELGFRPTAAELPDHVDTALVAAGHVVVTSLSGIRVAEREDTHHLLAVLEDGLGVEEGRG